MESITQQPLFGPPRFLTCQANAVLVRSEPNHGRETIKPDHSEAQRHLALLDPNALSFTFQTFDDDQDRTDSSLAQIIHGPLDQHWQTLVTLNRRGAGVYITINETDGRGRRKENITRIRAIWQECDRGDEPPLPCDAHIEVESSKGKYHRYVLTDSNAINEFEAVQQRLVDDFGSDSNAKDRSRMLRLAGFFHQKRNKRKGLNGQPFMVRIVSTSEQPSMAWTEVKRHFPPVLHKEKAIVTTVKSQTQSGNSNGELVQIAEIFSALKACPAKDVSYTEWLSIGMALHHHGDGCDEALSTWEEWSRLDHVRFKPRECQEKWLSFKGSGITLKTLFGICRQHGWNGRYRQNNQRCHELAHIQRARMLADFNRRHGVLMVEGQAVIIYREADVFSDEDYKAHYGVQTRFASPQSMAFFYKTLKIPEPSKGISQDGAPTYGVKLKELFPIWSRWAGRRTYKKITFKPVAGLIASDKGTSLPSGDVYNLYSGITFAPREGKPEEFNLILNHIRMIWCRKDEKTYEYVLSWFARLVQKPDEIGHSVIVLRSKEGGGKNLIVEIFTRLFGTNACTVTDSGDLTSRFNDHLALSVFSFLNESTWGGFRQSVGRLKALITDRTITVEKKYLLKFQVRNYSHIIIAGNHDWVAPVAIHDRRYFYLDLSDERRGDFEYFGKLAEQIENSGQETFLHFLMARDISTFNPRDLPQNQSESKLDNQLRAADSALNWLIEIIGDCELTDDLNNLITQGEWSNGPVRVSKTKFYSAYCQWCRLAGYGIRREHSAHFWRKVRGYLPIQTSQVKEKDPWGNDVRVRVVELPDNATCRHHVRELLKGNPWPDEDD